MGSEDPLATVDRSPQRGEVKSFVFGQGTIQRIRLWNFRRWIDSSRKGQRFQVLLVFLPVALQAGLIIRDYISWIPVWSWYADPGYSYLLAGASLISGGAPAFVFHPGTSFQLLVGSLERLTFSLVGRDSFFVDVVSRPEFYAQAVGVGIGMLYVGALSFVAWRLLRYWGWLPSLIFQLMALWGLPVISDARYHLWPESLVLTSSFVVFAILAPFMVHGGRQIQFTTILFLGVVAAIGVTAKVVFVPIVLLILLLIPSRRILTFVATFVVTITLILLPIRSQWPLLWQWFSGIASSTDRHGGGDPSSALENLIIGHTTMAGFLRWYVPVTVALVVASIFMGISQTRKTSLSIRPTIAMLVALLFAGVLSLKQSQPRDLIVIVPLLAALAAHLVFRLEFNQSHWRPRAYLALVFLVALSFLASHGIVHQQNFAKVANIRIKQVVGDAPLVEALAQSGSWGLGYNVWTQGNAIMFGSKDGVMFDVSFSDNLLDEEISAAYPDAMHFDFWSGQFQRINDDSELSVVLCRDLEEILASKDSALGIVVESENHVRLDSSREKIFLADGEATYVGPIKIGSYFAYQLTSLDCR